MPYLRGEGDEALCVDSVVAKVARLLRDVWLLDGLGEGVGGGGVDVLEAGAQGGDDGGVAQAIV